MSGETSRPRAVTRWYYGWTILAIIVLSQLFMQGVYTSFSFFVRPWLSEFGGTRAQITLAFLISQLSATLLAPVLGPLLDKRSIRVIIGAGFAWTAAGFVALATFAHSTNAVIVIYSVSMMIGFSACGPLPAFTLTAKWFRGHRGLALGICNLGIMLSGFVMIPVATTLLTHFGWRGAFYMFAGISAAFGALIFLFVRNKPEDLGLALEPEGPGETNHMTSNPQSSWTTKQILANRNFWITGLAFVLTVVAAAGYISNFEPFAHDSGLDATKAGIALQTMSFCGLFSIVAGRLTDKIDHRILVLASIALNTAAYLLMTNHPSFNQLMISSMLLGLAFASFMPLQGAIIARCFGAESFGKVFGYVSVFYIVGGLGAPIASLIRDQTGSYDLFYYGAAILVPCFGLIVLFLKPPKATIAAPAILEPAPTEAV